VFILNFSVIVPIHNEERFLPYTLPSIYNIDPSEVILIFDRCIDNSKKVSKKIAESCHKDHLTRYIELSNNRRIWKFRSAYVRRLGFNLTKYNYILNVDADIVLDPNIKNHIKKLVNNLGLISFGYLDYPYTFQNFIKKLISKIYPKIGFTGQYAFNKKAWKETEDIDELKHVHKGEDTYLKQSIEEKYSTLFIETRSLHLRPSENKQKHFMRGFANWEVQRKNVIMMFLHSIIYLRPASFAGYIHARYIYPNNKEKTSDEQKREIF
jgi:glycosyltransferase involved in cell wall biosynthesis